MVGYSGAILVLICFGGSSLLVWGGYAIASACATAKKIAPHTFTDELKADKLPTGFYIIAGRQRIGKTSLASAIMITDFMYHGSERVAEAANEIFTMNSIDPSWDLHVPDIAYRSKDIIQLDPRAGVESLHIDITQFGLPGGKLNVQYLPPATFLNFPELDADLNCREWSKTPMEIIDALKWLGHQNLTIMADMQSFGRVDAALRELTTDLWYVLDRRDRYKRVGLFSRRKRLVATEWTFLWLKPQENAMLRDVLRNRLPEDLQKLLIKKASTGYRLCKFRFDGNIYERYNSCSGKAYFYHGLNDFYVEPHVEYDFSREAIDAICNQNPLSFRNDSYKGARE